MGALAQDCGDPDRLSHRASPAHVHRTPCRFVAGVPNTRFRTRYASERVNRGHEQPHHPSSHAAHFPVPSHRSAARYRTVSMGCLWGHASACLGRCRRIGHNSLRCPWGDGQCGMNAGSHHWLSLGLCTPRPDRVPQIPGMQLGMMVGGHMCWLIGPTRCLWFGI